VSRSTLKPVQSLREASCAKSCPPTAVIKTTEPSPGSRSARRSRGHLGHLSPRSLPRWPPAGPLGYAPRLCVYQVLYFAENASSMGFSMVRRVGRGRYMRARSHSPSIELFDSLPFVRADKLSITTTTRPPCAAAWVPGCAPRTSRRPPKWSPLPHGERGGAHPLHTHAGQHGGVFLPRLGGTEQ
jgi:hypothetical protein